jgi:hypothetical protein
VSSPYRSSSLSIFEITYSKAVYRTCACLPRQKKFCQCPDNDFIGVVGFDLLIEAIQKLINDLTVTSNGTGYATLYTTNARAGESCKQCNAKNKTCEGLVIAHQAAEWSKCNLGPPHIDEIMGKGFYAKYGQDVVDNKARLENYVNPRDGKTRSVSTVNVLPLYNANGQLMPQYYLSVLWDRDAAYKQVDMLEARINDKKQVAVSVILGVGLGTLVVAVLVSIGIAFYIAAPVIALGGPEGLAEKAIKNARTTSIAAEIDDNYKGHDEKNPNEIGLLYEEFKNMSRKIDAQTSD